VYGYSWQIDTQRDSQSLLHWFDRSYSINKHRAGIDYGHGFRGATENQLGSIEGQIGTETTVGGLLAQESVHKVGDITHLVSVYYDIRTHYTGDGLE
jgi:hypothetical protein